MIFEGDGHAVQRPTVHARMQFLLCPRSLLECQVRRDGDERVQAGIEFLDSLDRQSRQLERRDSSIALEHGLQGGNQRPSPLEIQVQPGHPYHLAHEFRSECPHL